MGAASYASVTGNQKDIYVLYIFTIFITIRKKMFFIFFHESLWKEMMSKFVSLQGKKEFQKMHCFSILSTFLIIFCHTRTKISENLKKMLFSLFHENFTKETILNLWRIML